MDVLTFKDKNTRVDSELTESCLMLLGGFWCSWCSWCSCLCFARSSSNGDGPRYNWVVTIASRIPPSWSMCEGLEAQCRNSTLTVESLRWFFFFFDWPHWPNQSEGAGSESRTIIINFICNIVYSLFWQLPMSFPVQLSPKNALIPGKVTAPWPPWPRSGRLLMPYARVAGESS